MIADSTELLARAASHHDKFIVQWFEAAIKVQAVAQMLSASQNILGEHDGGTTALHLAARYDHDLVAVQLLTEDPSLADAVNDYKWDALRTAATYGSEKVVAVLLAKSPHVIHAGNSNRATAMHFAARDGHDKVVAQLLAADSNLANVVDASGYIPLHYAASKGHEVVLDMLLAVNPQLIFYAVDGFTILHLACESPARNKEFFARLLALNPGALHVVNFFSNTPFDSAVSYGNDSAIEVLQREFTFEEIVSVFTKHKESFQGRLRPIVEGQCVCLVESSLNRDVVGIVFEYLGL